MTPMTIEPTQDDLDLAADFAADYYRYVNEADYPLDRRKVNAVIAKIADAMTEQIRHIDGKITTTRYNERVIWSVPRDRNPLRDWSFEIEVDEHAYEDAALPKQDFVDSMKRWVVARAESVAREAADAQADAEADPRYQG